MAGFPFDRPGGQGASPATRADFAKADGLMPAFVRPEAGKFFPETASGLTDPVANTDQRNGTPPADGQIASAGLPEAAELDKPGSHFRKHSVRGGESLKVTWPSDQLHMTRRWNYFITRPSWSPQATLTRAQFEAEPFYTAQNTQQPFWSYRAELASSGPVTHEVLLPQRSGYHVILAVHEVADTGSAFYHVIDVDFTDAG
ncbi:lytic polysaccharide monooxygenase auxiliary activity family 9 protein [Streptomyces sp. NPDC051546]|uniref:lytic polysaccharide monooxygenase auxiliary activity family 9 protein n=1 Tax=Streptomyces sp. NPDC051546 TaxID=3365655 RepID=UPI0037AAD9D0